MNALVLRTSMLILVAVAGCKSAAPPPVVVNKAVVQEADSDTVILSVSAKSGSRIWLDYWEGGAGCYGEIRRDTTTRVTYRRMPKGFSVIADNVFGMNNGQASNVVFFENPQVQDGQAVIGTYSQLGTDNIKIVFRLE